MNTKRYTYYKWDLKELDLNLDLNLKDTDLVAHNFHQCICL